MRGRHQTAAPADDLVDGPLRSHVSGRPGAAEMDTAAGSMFSACRGVARYKRPLTSSFWGASNDDVARHYKSYELAIRNSAFHFHMSTVG